MKRVRLLVIPPTDDHLKEALGLQAVPADLGSLRQQMTVNYKRLLQEVLRTPLEGKERGVGIEEMERSLALLKIIDLVAEDEVLELEDTDHEYVLRKLAAVRFFGWAAFDARVVGFCHTLRNATKDVLDAAQPS